MVRTELKIQKLQCWCMPAIPKRQMKSQQQGLAMELATEFCLMTWTCPVSPSTVFHMSWRKTNITIIWAFAVTWSINSADKDGTVLNRIITGDKTWYFLYSLQQKWQSATWKSSSIPRAGQVKRQGNALTVFQLVWNCLHVIHPRRRYCKQATLQGDPLLST
jgi:hypothetical protein